MQPSACSRRFKGILINPIIIAALSAYLIKIIGITLPDFAFSFITEIASIATPLAIIVLGGSVSYSHVERNKKQLVIGTAVNCSLFPSLVSAQRFSWGSEMRVLSSLCRCSHPPLLSPPSLWQSE